MRTRALSIAVIVSSLILMALPSSIEAIPRINLLACRDVASQDLFSAGTQLNPVGCSREFPTSIPYIVLFMEIAEIDYPAVFAWQLADPSDEVFARSRRQINPTPGYMWTYFVIAILPVAATEKEIVEKNPRFRYSVVEIGAKPLSEMPGEWKLRASLSSAAPVTIRFTLRP